MTHALSPYIRRAWYDVLQPGQVIRERVIFDYEFLYVKEGKALITIGDDLYTGEPGDLFIFRPRQRHSISMTFHVPLIQPHVHFDLTYSPDREEVPISFDNLDAIPAEKQGMFREDILDSFLSPFPQHLHLHSPMLIEQQLFDLIHAFENPGLYHEIRLSYFFLRLFDTVLSEATYTRSQRRTEDLPAQIKFFLEQNVSHAVTVEELIQLTHFSRSYIFRSFRESYRISPLRYHMLLRMERAKSMLRYTNLSVSEIAAVLGFDRLQDFSRVFKRVTGESPSQFRATLFLDDADADKSTP